MDAAVRALSLWLIVWLTAAASFAPCCWSMANAHDHEAQHTPSGNDVRPQEHDHHGSADATVPAAATLEMSAIPVRDCNAEFDEAVATAPGPLSSVDARSASAVWADVMVPQASATRAERSDSAPPGGSPGSAFLNPLRI